MTSLSMKRVESGRHVSSFVLGSTDSVDRLSSLSVDYLPRVCSACSPSIAVAVPPLRLQIVKPVSNASVLARSSLQRRRGSSSTSYLSTVPSLSAADPVASHSAAPTLTAGNEFGYGRPTIAASVTGFGCRRTAVAAAGETGCGYRRPAVVAAVTGTGFSRHERMKVRKLIALQNLQPTQQQQTTPRFFDPSKPTAKVGAGQANKTSRVRLEGGGYDGGERKDDAYWERRRKNNEAAKRSRDARRAKEDHIALRAALLERENVQLRTEVAFLKSETCRLHYLLFSKMTASY